MISTIFDNGVPFIHAVRDEGDSGVSKSHDGTCRSLPRLEADAESQGEGGGDRVVNAGFQTTVGTDVFETHCAQFNGVFAQQCSRVSQALASNLKKKKKGKVVSRARLESAITKTGVCKVDHVAGTFRDKRQSVSSGAAKDGLPASGRGGCRARGDCTIYR
jgi:hypothetical protein